ncbi:hypothetical protein GOV14_00615 [Candidatus Pacearchaeota archaeon]|nr:hypothetical protein [Candidatus Pacearchaeota archaeon]
MEEENKTQDTEKEKVAEVKEDAKDTEKKKEPPKKDSKDKKEAIINGKNIPASTKQSVAVCNFIRGKKIDDALNLLEKASTKKIAIPMKGEIPHRKGMMSGRYPINTIKQFINLLKGLKANATVNELEYEKYQIFCKANVAARPYKRFGKGKFKRSNITIKLIPKNN